MERIKRFKFAVVLQTPYYDYDVIALCSSEDLAKHLAEACNLANASDMSFTVVDADVAFAKEEANADKP